MKKFFLLFALLLGMTSCNNDPELDTPNPEPDPRPALSTTVPVTEALDELYGLMDDVAADTRAGAAFDRARKIRDIRVSGARAATRTGAYDLPDTLVYVVNFSDDQGFAVLGAQRSLEPVYVLTESGTFDAAKLDAAIAAAIAEKSAPSSATRTAPDPEQPVAELGTDYVYHMLADAVTAVPHIAPIDTISITYGPWEIYKSYGPHMVVKWDQTYPFNAAMGTSSYWANNSYKGRYPVGCGIIAAAQIMSHTCHPTSAPGKKGNYNWTRLRSVSNYLNYTNYTPSFYDTADIPDAARTYTTQFADFLNYFGIQAKASYGIDGTSVYATNNVSALKNIDSYYSDARLVDFETNLSSIYENLRNNKPMYIRGSSTAGGHAWVVDGYLTRKRRITFVARMGYSSPYETMYGTEYKAFLHFNWGYQGKCDGYYAVNIFDMTQRDSRDDVIDTNPSAGITFNFNTNNQVILY